MSQQQKFWQACENGDAGLAEKLINKKLLGLFKAVDIEKQNQNEENALLLAAKNGHTEVVKLLLNNNANPTSKDSKGRSGLMLAAFNGHKEIVKILLKHKSDSDIKLLTDQLLANLKTITIKQLDTFVLAGIDLKVKTKDGMNLLMEAVLLKRKDLMEYLIKKNFPIDEKDNLGCTALMYAVKNGLTKEVSFLINNGADPNKKDSDGQTPLMISAANGFSELVEYLLHNGANAKEVNSKNETALYLATEMGWTQSVELILNHLEFDLITDVADDRKYYEIDELKDIPDLVNNREYDKALKILKAKEKEYPDYFFLYIWKISITVKKKDRRKALNLCLEGVKNSKMKAIIIESYAYELLKEERSILFAIPYWLYTIRIMLASKNLNRYVPFLFISYVAGNVGMKKLSEVLLEYSDQVQPGEFLRLDQAMQNLIYKGIREAEPRLLKDIKESLKRISILVGIETDELTEEITIDYKLSGRLIGAYNNNDIKSVENLLSKGADPNAIFTETATLLMVACAHGNIDAVRLLCKYKADINRGDAKGFTALMIASQFGHLEIVKLLIEFGADREIENFQGATAAWLGLQYGHQDIYNYLNGTDYSINVINISE